MLAVTSDIIVLAEYCDVQFLYYMEAVYKSTSDIIVLAEYCDTGWYRVAGS